jgi:hypothetical protein
MKLEQIKNILSKNRNCPSKWELDNIIYNDRTSDPTALVNFLTRIETLSSIKVKTDDDELELTYLLDLLEDMDEDECIAVMDHSDETAKDVYIERLARTGAVEVLTGGKVSFDTMNTSCKLSPNDFILCAKRTQDIITAIHGLAIKGETLSQDVAGA